MSSGRERGETSDEHGPLPSGWKTKLNRDVDPPRRMYYNRGTGKTSWSRPVDAEARAGSAKPAAAPAAAPDAESIAAASPTSVADSAPEVPPYDAEAAVRVTAGPKLEEDDTFIVPDTADFQDDSPYVKPEYNTAGCASKCCCVIFAILAVLSVGVCIVMVTVIVAFEGERDRPRYFVMLGCFFAVLATLSVVMCITLLVPRYTGTTGIKCMRWKHQQDLLAEESWVWSMRLRGNFVGKSFKVVFAMGLAWLKFAQLFALTYDPATIDELPEIYVEIGDFVLLDIERLVETTERNATVAAGLGAAESFVGDNLGLQLNISKSSFVTDANKAVFTALEFAGGPEAYRNKFGGYASLSVLVTLIVALGVCFGCMEGKPCGRKSQICEKFFIMLLSWIVEFMFLPLYHHLLSALDCSEVEVSRTLNNVTTTSKVWKWDVDISVTCFEGDVFDFDFKDPPHLVYFLAAIIAIFLTVMAAGFYLMVRPDTWKDHKQKEIWRLISKTDKWQRELNDKYGRGHISKRREEHEFMLRLRLPALRLREVARKKYGVEHEAVVNVDTRGCCASELDCQEDGISQIQRRPREAPVAFMLEASIATVAVLMSTDGLTVQGEFNDAVYEADKLKLKLFAIGVICLLLALFMCNPLVLLCGGRKCSPYKDLAGIEHRTNVWQMGYPYNWEPLNFFRSYLMIICSSFAIFQLLSFNYKRPSDSMPAGLKVEPRKAMLFWMYSCVGLGALYILMLLVRWRRFCRDSSKRQETKTGRP